MCRELIIEQVSLATTLAELSVGVAEWEEWHGEVEQQLPVRSDKEEKYLWAMSTEVDRELAREEKKMQAKKYRVVASAKKRMGVGREQPRTLESLNKGCRSRKTKASLDRVDV